MNLDEAKTNKKHRRKSLSSVEKTVKIYVKSGGRTNQSDPGHSSNANQDPPSRRTVKTETRAIHL